MEDAKKPTSERTEKIKSWLKDKYNLYLLAVLAFSLAVLLYYFFKTSQQALWWDEAEYLAIAKRWAFDVPSYITPKRPPLFPFLASLLYRFGFQELGMKFLLSTFPQFLCVLFTYLLVKEIYDKKIALLAALIMSVSWIHLFYAVRVMTDSIGFLFGLLALLCFWKGYVKGNKKYTYFIGFFIALSFMIRLTGIFYAGIIFVFLLFTDKFKFLKSKELWISVFIAFLTITPSFIWAYYYHGSALASSSGFGGTPDVPPAWNLIRFVYDYPELGFFIFFLIGLLTLLPMIISFDLTLRGKEKKYNNDLFMLILIIVILALYIFLLRSAENRWMMPMSLGIFAISAKGIFLLYDIIKKYSNKILAVFLALVIIVAGVYFQLNHTTQIIDMKKDSYMPVKQSALWIKENSEKSDILLSTSRPQVEYYAERETISYFKNQSILRTEAQLTEEEFEGIIKEKKPKYLVVSVFDNNPDWINSWVQKNYAQLNPMYASFEDKEKTKPNLIVYGFKYY